jgi:hypothetical protein
LVDSSRRWLAFAKTLIVTFFVHYKRETVAFGFEYKQRRAGNPGMVIDALEAT